jgi:hypothetical protein
MILPLAYFYVLVPLLLPVLLVGAWFVLFLFSKPVEAIRRVEYSDFFGPGGPDDPLTVRIPRDVYDELLARRDEQTDIRSAA